MNITENAKHKAAVELKKKGRQAGQYTGYDDEEFGEDGGVGSKKGVLSKYDEGFEGVKEDGFQLGDQIVVKKNKSTQNGDGNGMDNGGEREKVKLSMEYTKSFNTDYLQEGDAGFKKPKVRTHSCSSFSSLIFLLTDSFSLSQMKKKKRPARTTTISSSLNDDDPSASTSNEMDIDSASTSSALRQIERTSLDSSNLIDDDDLAVSLARQRREAAKRQIKEMKERARLAVENPLAIKEEDEDETREEGTKKEEEARGGDGDDVLVMDDTSEFVRNIRVAAEEAASRPQRKPSVVPKKEDGKLDMRGLESVQPRIKEEEQEVPLSEMSTGGWNAATERDEEEEDALMRNLDERPRSEDGREDGETEESKPKVSKGTGDDDEEFGTTGGEKLVSKGLASTLSILRHQGLMKPRTPEEIAKEKEFKEREAWLTSQRRRDAERERERIESRNAGDRKDQRQREYENKLRDQRDAQAALEAYQNYKPVVDIKYHDEFGRDMTPKEVSPTFRFLCLKICLVLTYDTSLQAWKHLSHAFHGHGHGSMKTEKRLKKIENERKAAAMAAGDTPNSTAAAFAARAEKTGSATMILGVGNNKSVPSCRTL